MSAAAPARTGRRAGPPEDSQFSEIGGVRLRYIEAGDGPPLLLLHGAMSSATDMRLALSGHLGGWRSVYLDRPGLGWSDRPRGDWTPEREAALIADFVQATGLGAPVVIGHSWGAAIAMRLAMDHPGRVSGLVLIAPALRAHVGEAAWYNKAARLPLIGPLMRYAIAPLAGPLMLRRGLATTFHPHPVPAGYVEAAHVARVFHPAVFNANAADMARANHHLAAQEDRYGEIACPAVVLAGPRDRVVWTHRHSVPVTDIMPAARLVLDKAWGHMLHHYAQDAVAEAVADVAARARIAP